MLAAMLVAANGSSGCASANDHAPQAPEGDAGVAGAPPPGGCGTDKGCPCEHPGDSVDCRAYRKSGGYVACSPGKRLCGADGRWGDCLGDQVAP
jgi:hypothetical protein